MKLKYILGLCFVAVLIAVYYSYNPEVYDFFPACPLHKYTGLDCPGCGSQRAIHALLHGDVQAALDYNLLLVISLPFLAVHFFLKLLSYLLQRNLHWKIWYKPVVPKIVFLVVIGFWIARNLPVSPFSYLAS